MHHTNNWARLGSHCAVILTLLAHLEALGSGGPRIYGLLTNNGLSAENVTRVQESFSFSALGSAVMVDESYFGTWRLVVERSTFNGAPPPRECTRTVGDRHHGLISTVIRTVDLDGAVHDSAYVSRIDGRPYLTSEPGSDPPTLIVETSEDRLTTRFVLTRAGEVIASGTRILQDGHEMRIETESSDGYGQAMTSITIWEKVG